MGRGDEGDGALMPVFNRNIHLRGIWRRMPFFHAFLPKPHIALIQYIKLLGVYCFEDAYHSRCFQFCGDLRRNQYMDTILVKKQERGVFSGTAG